MNAISVTHRCADRDCIYFSKPTDRGCLCHKSERTMLEEAAEALLGALKGIMTLHEPEGRFQPSSFKPLLSNAVAAVAQAEGLDREAVIEAMQSRWLK